MLAAVKGIIRGNTVVIEDDDIRAYDGSEVVVTLLEHHARPQRQVSKKLHSTGTVLFCQVPAERMSTNI